MKFFMKRSKSDAYTAKVEVPKPPTVDELAALVEKRDRLSREYEEATNAVGNALESVGVGTYVAADGGIVCVSYQPYDRALTYLTNQPRPKAVKFTRPLREIRPEVKVTGS